MKRTSYKFLVSITNTSPIYRRVWEDNGRFFVRYNGEWNDVSDKQDEFRSDLK